MITPLQSLTSVTEALALPIDLRIKRDDLFPMPGGGNKARKIQTILQYALNHGYTALVTNGGPQSNHARATAIVAAQHGLHCHLVIHLQPGISYPNTGNILLMRLAGAEVDLCRHEELAERMDRAMERLTKNGHRPLYIWGGGHCVQGTIPFVEAAGEFQGQAEDWHPDFLVFASATGTTQAGFIIGFAPLGTRVIGISIARSTARGAPIVEQSIAEYQEHLGLPQSSFPVEFRDEWTCGGYEQTCPELLSIIRTAARAGLFVDPTYSGKALWGLVELVRSGQIPAGSKVLFWHTGGLMNLMAAPDLLWKGGGGRIVAEATERRALRA